MKTVSKHKKSILVALLLSTFISVGKFAFGQSPVPGCDASFKQSTAPFAILAIYTPYNWVSLEAENKNYQSYTWDFGDGITASGKYSVLHQYAKPGKYLVTLKVYNPTVGQLQVICEDTKSLWISVSDSSKCDASFSHNVFIVKTNPPSYYVTLTAKNQKYRSYTWDFGDGIQDTGRTVTHHYAKDGTYYVTLKTFNSTTGNTQVICEDRKTETIVLGEVKNCDASFTPIIQTTYSIPPIQHVTGFSVPTGHYTSYKWDFGDGTSGSGYHVAHEYAQEGKYYVTLTVWDEKTECTDTKSVWVTEGKVREDSSLCKAQIIGTNMGKEITVRDAYVFYPLIYDGTKVLRTWDWGDGSKTDEGETATHTYRASGKFMVTLTKTVTRNPCHNIPTCYAAPIVVCTEKYTYPVIIEWEDTLQCTAAPASEIDGLKVKLFDRLVVDYFGNSIYEKHMWDFGDGTTGNGRSVEHTYPAAKLYTARLTKTILKDICPPNPGGVSCLAMPVELCSQTYDVIIDLRDTKDTLCKASFSTFIEKNTITVKTNQVAGIGYAKLDFGDGDVIETKGSQIVASHTYPDKGEYSLCFRIATVPDSLLPVVLLTSYCSDTYCEIVSVRDSLIKSIVPYPTDLKEISYSSGVSVRAYPTPAQDVFHLNVKNTISDLTLRLYNAMGNQVKEVSNITNGDVTVLVPELESGVYMYSVSDQDGIVSKGKVLLVK